jgi:hypothetical protein
MTPSLLVRRDLAASLVLSTRDTGLSTSDTLATVAYARCGSIARIPLHGERVSCDQFERLKGSSNEVLMGPSK